MIANAPGSGPPYPGLRPFRRNESYLFFGRDDCSNAMVSCLAATHFLAVLGSSGSGKSSLVNTGLIDSLELGFMAQAGSHWRIASFRPEGMPLRNLARSLLATENDIGREDFCKPDREIDISRLRARLKNERSAINAWCDEGHLPKGTSLLVLVDQFEELFRYQSYAERDEAEAFVARLIEIKKASASAKAQGQEFPIYVTITMRSEFLGACSLIPGLAEAINEGAFLTPRMTRSQCELAIRGPAQVCGIGIEDALVNKLLNDLADFAAWDESPRDPERGPAAMLDQLNVLARRADQLPLMQHALNQLWSEAKAARSDGEALDRHVVLTLDAYTEIGGLSGALDRHADAIFNLLGPQREPIIEAVFRALTSGATVADAVRWPTAFGDLVKISGGDRAMVEAVVNAFRAPGCNFLLPEIDQKPQPDDETKIDITHESLIRQWKRLSGWLEKETHAGQEWRRLIDLARSGDFVLRGLRLTNAIELLNEIHKKPAWAGRYGNSFEQVKRLIDTSRTRRRVIRLTGAAVAGALVVLCGATYRAYLTYRTSVEASVYNFELAVKSAQKLLNQVSDSFNYGSISVKGARDLLQTAGAIADQVRDRAQTLETTELMINLQLKRSDIRYSLRDFEQAYQIAQDAKALVQPLLNADPRNLRALLLAFSTSTRMADALADRGDEETLAQGLEEFQYAEKLARTMAEMAPGNAARERDIMFVLQKMGDIRQEQSDWNRAIAKYSKALEIIARVVDKEPDNLTWKRDLANCHSRLGQALSGKGEFGDALAHLRIAFDIRSKLASPDSNDNVIQSNLALSHIEFARLFEAKNELDKALEEFRSVKKIREALAEKDPSNAASSIQLAATYMDLGRILRTRGESALASDEYKRAVDVRQGLAIRDPTNVDRQDTLAASRYALAEVLGLLKRPDEALQNYEYAALALEDLADNLTKDRPKKAAAYRGRAFDSRMKMGDIFVTKDNHDAALGEYRKAFTIAQQLATQDENDASWQRNLASVHDKIGDQLAWKQDPGGALEQYNAAVAIMKKLSEGANNPEWMQLLETLQSKAQALLTKQ
jgi:tetratricopeptide (TPR) repeat protein